MLFIVLVLVLAALGLLIAALITANSLWAWISIGLSVAAGLLLVVDFVRRRVARRRASAVAEQAEEPAAGASTDDDEPSTPEATTVEKPADKPAPETPAAEVQDAPADQTALIPTAGELVGTAEEGEPGEESTDPADAAIVDELDVEVVVVDEHPRYHLTDCGWLADRDTIPISVKEARDLGFTPCARCTPDAHLAEAHRAKA
ncbi:SPOR domain-containing protein [Amycolatopsis thermoflava]|uniref:SPOR domain-containing protein n=1 Tax=Amycolatopsis thermoflava TaxID=84480 RepID=UPI00364B9CD5